MIILSTEKIKEKIIAEIEKETHSLAEKIQKKPKLLSIMVGVDSENLAYSNSIKKSCEKVGMDYELYRYEIFEPKMKSGILEDLQKFNNNKDINGILIHQPLPKEIDNLPDNLSLEKDVEGITFTNLGKLLLNEPCFIPSTPLSVLTILDEYKINVEGKKVCIIGRSNIVGKPLYILMMQRNATVTVCHSKTNNIEEETKRSDIIIVAMGKPLFLKKEMVKEGSVIIDVGTNFTETGLVGDVDYENVKNVVSMITPVPKGVGALTNVMIVKNVLRAFKNHYDIE